MSIIFWDSSSYPYRKKLIIYFFGKIEKQSKFFIFYHLMVSIYLIFGSYNLPKGFFYIFLELLAQVFHHLNQIPKFASFKPQDVNTP